MISLAARHIAGRAASPAVSVTRRAAKAARVPRSSARKVSLIYKSSRVYTTETVSTWTAEDLGLLGSYKGNPTPRGQKKTSTGLTGLEVQPEAREVLIALYKKIASELTKLPSTYAYRVDSELYIQRRLSILLEETDALRAEEELDAGQLESLIGEAEDELNHVIPSLLEFKPWETHVSKWDTPAHIYSDVKHV